MANFGDYRPQPWMTDDVVLRRPDEAGRRIAPLDTSALEAVAAGLPPTAPTNPQAPMTMGELVERPEEQPLMSPEQAFERAREMTPIPRGPMFGFARENVRNREAAKLVGTIMSREIEQRRLQATKEHNRAMQDLAAGQHFTAALQHTLGLDPQYQKPVLKAIWKMYGMPADFQGELTELMTKAAEDENIPVAQIFDELTSGKMTMTKWRALGKNPEQAVKAFTDAVANVKRKEAAGGVQAAVPGPAGKVHAAAIEAGLGAAETKLAVQAAGGEGEEEKVDATHRTKASVLYPNIPWARLDKAQREVVDRAVKADKVEVSASQGAAAAGVSIEKQLDTPVMAATGYGNKMFLSRETGKPIALLGKTVRDLETLGKEGKIVQLDPELGRRYTDLLSTERMLPLMKDIANRALTTGEVPGANLMNRAAQDIKIAFGIDTPMIELKAIKGVRLLLARLMQGAAQQLSNLDVHITEHLGIDENDSIPLAMRKLGVLEKILDFQKKAVLDTGEAGKTPPVLLRELSNLNKPGAAALDYLKKRGVK